jgi:hypothetical protein
VIAGGGNFANITHIDYGELARETSLRFDEDARFQQVITMGKSTVIVLNFVRVGKR